MKEGGRERERDLKSRTGGPSGAGTVISQHEARARRQHDLELGLLLIPKDAASPRLQRIKDSERWTPGVEGQPEKRASQPRASQTEGPPVGRKRARVYRSRFPET